MDVQSKSFHDLFEGLPCLVGLPSCGHVRPEYRGTPLTEVCVAEERPPYLLLGSLDRGSFRSAETEWSVRWIGVAPETFVEAHYERATRRLRLRQVGRGVEGGNCHTTGEHFGCAIQHLYFPFPEAWDQAMRARLEGAYRLRYIPETRDQYSFTGLPDGAFRTIGVPVPITRLATMHDCVAQLGRDPELTVPMAGRLELRLSAVNYVTGRGPAWTGNPDRLSAASFNANGLLPLGPPQLEAASSGTSAWTVRRFVYLALIQVPFVGVEFAIERLAERGLIRRRTDGGALEPGIEFDAFVGPSTIALQGRSVAWMDGISG